MIALIPVRDGVLPAGAAETISECDGRALIIGSSTDEVDLDGLARSAVLVEAGVVQPMRWTSLIVPVLASLRDVDTDIVVLPHSPDGRDLAPHLALALDRPLFSGATEVAAHRVRVARRGGLELHGQRPTGAFVATLQTAARGPVTFDGSVDVTRLEPPAAATRSDARVVEVLPPDVATMDLTEARRIVGGGAGLADEDRFRRLDRFATLIGGVMGATRVITDRAWVHHDRQIGTTGVVVDPELYVSFGVSGAVQHTSGLGHPHHIVSVNTDPHCPMMAMSDLAIVADANATLDELLRLLDTPAAEVAHG